MPSEEQAELVDKLKAKWDDVNSRCEDNLSATVENHFSMSSTLLLLLLLSHFCCC